MRAGNRAIKIYRVQQYERVLSKQEAGLSNACVKMGQPPFDLLFDDEHSEFVWQHAGDVLSGLVPFDHIYPLVAFAGEEYVPFYWSINQPKKDIYHNNLSQKGFRKHLSHPPLVVNFFVLRQLLSLLPSHS